MLAPASPIYIGSAMLADAAFGTCPGRAATELPAAVRPLDTWYRAVILGGQGCYAAAREELRSLSASTADPVLLSLAASTGGSLLRQLGWHARAAAFDGRAAALILPTGSVDRDEFAPNRVDAVCDALTGLAADALGTGRLALATRLLRRSHDELTRAGSSAGWRALIRWHWVCAETALASGAADTAAPHAATALALAEDGPSVRHRVKSRLLVAATAAASGDGERARVLADEVAEQCREHELLPLRWASSMLRAGVCTGTRVTAAEADARRSAETIGRRGGHFRPMSDSRL
ncbi:hypothetical protein ACQP0C_36520 [Nocardia sp. CA-129566]|uniref:hypothetical protein n=1 Tax=Nocardia sp. CA-129566 TaxID=3239976 RepID=UPI003D98E16F